MVRPAIHCVSGVAGDGCPDCRHLLAPVLLGGVESDVGSLQQMLPAELPVAVGSVGHVLQVLLVVHEEGRSLRAAAAAEEGRHIGGEHVGRRGIGSLIILPKVRAHERSHEVQRVHKFARLQVGGRLAVFARSSWRFDFRHDGAVVVAVRHVSTCARVVCHAETAQMRARANDVGRRCRSIDFARAVAVHDGAALLFIAHVQTVVSHKDSQIAAVVVGGDVGGRATGSDKAAVVIAETCCGIGLQVHLARGAALRDGALVQSDKSGTAVPLVAAGDDGHGGGRRAEAHLGCGTRYVALDFGTHTDETAHTHTACHFTVGRAVHHGAGAAHFTNQTARVAAGEDAGRRGAALKVAVFCLHHQAGSRTALLDGARLDVTAHVDVRKGAVLGTDNQTANERRACHVGILQTQVAYVGTIGQSEERLVPRGEVELARAEGVVPVVKVGDTRVPQVVDGMASAVERALEPMLPSVEFAGVVFVLTVLQ